MNRNCIHGLLAAITALSLAGELLVPGEAHACSLAEMPAEAMTLQPGEEVPSGSDAGEDAVAPSRPTLSEPRVFLVRNPCRGNGATCPQLDHLSFQVSATDDLTPLERMRYVAFFGDTAQEVQAQPHPELLFTHDHDSASRVSAFLGLDQKRTGKRFDRASLCFALAAVDEGGNVGERSEPLCLDTTDMQAPYAEVRQGEPCLENFGCSAGGLAPLAPLGLGLLGLLRRRGRASCPRQG